MPWREKAQWRPEWVPGSIHDRIAAAVSREPLSRSMIARSLGHEVISGAINRALADLLKAGLIAYTIPGKPNSRLQRYRLTEPGESNSTTSGQG